MRAPPPLRRAAARARQPACEISASRSESSARKRALQPLDSGHCIRVIATVCCVCPQRGQQRPRAGEAFLDRSSSSCDPLRPVRDPLSGSARRAKQRRESSSRRALRPASASSAASRRFATDSSSRSASARRPRASATAASAVASDSRPARRSSRATPTGPRAIAARAARAARPPRPGASSGRSRERASRSTSSARSRFCCVRSSFSCARRRRLRCLPSPAASSISSRRSRGLEVTSDSTRPWEMTECISLPSPVSESTSITSTSRQRAPAKPVLPLAGAIEPPDERDLGHAQAEATLASRRVPARPRPAPAAWRPGAPPKITSCIEEPRTAEADCSPSAHSTASVMLDFPDPLGPDDHAHPGTELEPGAIGERLEALERDRLQVHGTPSTLTLPAPPAPRARPPARHPSCCARCRGRPRCRRRPR